jgi:hypothetical protein
MVVGPSDALDGEAHAGSVGDLAEVGRVGSDHGVVTADGSFDDRDVDDVVVASAGCECANGLRPSVGEGSVAHKARNLAREAWREPPRHASASTAVGTVGETPSARRPAWSAHIRRSLRSAAISAPVS